MNGPRDFLGIWRSDERARAAYAEGAGIYRIVPAAVAVPATTAALAELVRWASSTGVALVPRGAGSGMPGGNVGPGVVLDLAALDGAPLAVDAERQLARTGAAVTLGALDEAARRRGLRMPVDPSSLRWATAGGAVATNASGARTVKYGSIRRWVQALEIVTADGEHVTLERGVPAPDCAAVRRVGDGVEPALRLARWRIAAGFPKVRKNTAGYALDSFLTTGDLVDLILGSEGTLALVTAVTWRLEPIPPARAGVRAALRDARRLSHVVPALLELAPARLEFLDGTLLRYLAEDLRSIPQAQQVVGSGALLMLELEGASAADLAPDVERAVGILRADSVEVLAARDDQETEALWAIRHAVSPRLAQLGEERRSLQVIEDGCVPIERVGDYIVALREAAERRNVPVVMFGHAGDGHVHANLLPDVTRNGWVDAVRSVFESAAQTLIALGGTPSGEHGDGRLRASLVERVYGWEITQLFRVVKRAFDPLGILNPGVKVAAGGGDPFGNLKVGPGAVTLPADLEGSLRWIERQVGYATDRLALADDPLA